MSKLLTNGAGALAIAATLLLVSACANSAATPNPPAATTTGAQVAPPPAASPTSASKPEPGHTCPPTTAQIPAGAHQATTADVDYDGRPDTLWLADVNGARILGVRTASGATFSTTFTSPAPQATSALGQKMTGTDAPSIILLDTGRSAKLYTVADCAIVPTTNPQHAQYTFDLGFNGYGTGVECLSDNASYTLAGLLAEPNATGSGDAVYRTKVTLSDYGRHASNGTRQTLASNVDSQSTLAKHATSVTCGTNNAAVTEPRSG
jgi:hypothetical protein